MDLLFPRTSKVGEVTSQVHKTKKEFDVTDRKKIKKKYKANKLLVYGIGPDEYNKISTCDTIKEIWNYF